jgi:hypothetical protein
MADVAVRGAELFSVKLPKASQHTLILSEDGFDLSRPSAFHGSAYSRRTFLTRRRVFVAICFGSQNRQGIGPGVKAP